MNIREATKEDVPGLVNLWYELMNYHADHHLAFKAMEGTKDLIAEDLGKRIDQEDCRIFLYFLDDQLAGFINCSFRITLKAMVYHKRGYIAETVVGQQFRGNGIGQMLFERAEKWLIERGADHIELQVSLKNDGALNFWQNRGFSSTTRHMIKLLKKDS